MTMIDRTSLLETIPSLFAGDDRKVLEDWITNAPLARTSEQSEALTANLLTSGDPITMAAGYLMAAHVAKTVFDGMKAAEAAGISPADIEVALLRWVFGSIHASLNQRRADIDERIRLADRLSEEASDSCAKLVLLGVL